MLAMKSCTNIVQILYSYLGRSMLCILKPVKIFTDASLRTDNKIVNKKDIIMFKGQKL